MTAADYTPITYAMRLIYTDPIAELTETQIALAMESLCKRMDEEFTKIIRGSYNAQQDTARSAHLSNRVPYFPNS